MAQVPKNHERVSEHREVSAISSVKRSSDRAKMMGKMSSRLSFREKISEDEFRSSEDDGEDEFRLREFSEDEFSRDKMFRSRKMSSDWEIS